MRALEALAEALARELGARLDSAGYAVASLRRWGWRVQGAPGLRMAAEDLEDYVAEESTWNVTLAVYSDKDLPGHHPRPPRWSLEDSRLEIGGLRGSVYGPRMGPPAVHVESLRGSSPCRAEVEVDAVLGGERSYPAVIAWAGGANDVGPAVLASLTEDTFGPPAEEALKAAISLVYRLEGYDEPLRVIAGSRASSTWLSAGKWLARLTSEAMILYDSERLSITPPPPGEELGGFQAAVLESLRLQGLEPELAPLCPDPDYYVLLAHGVKASCLGVPRGLWHEVSAALAAAARARGLEGLQRALTEHLWLRRAEEHLARGDSVALGHLASLVWGSQAPGDLSGAPLDAESRGPAPGAPAVSAPAEALLEAVESMWRGFPENQEIVEVALRLVPALVARGYTLKGSLAVAEAVAGRLRWEGLVRGLEALGLLEEA